MVEVAARVDDSLVDTKVLHGGNPDEIPVDFSWSRKRRVGKVDRIHRFREIRLPEMER